MAKKVIRGVMCEVIPKRTDGIKSLKRKVWNSNQSWYFESLHETDKGEKLRVDIRRNAYDNQCHARVMIFNSDEKKWNHLNSIFITDLPCSGISYVQDGITVAQFVLSEQILLDESSLIL